LIVYPNPATSEITVCLPGLPGKYSGLTIHSQNGSLILSKKLSGQSETINLEQLLPGSYYLTVKGESVSIMTTIIKQ
jgi:hypothetical protein